MLVKRHGRLVKREEFLDEVWKDAEVEDGNLSTQISSLRKALGDSDSSPRYIETVRGLGFRFIAPVNRQPATFSPPSNSIENSNPCSGDFEVEAHRFVPVYLGSSVTGGTKHPTKWGDHQKLEFEDASLYLTQCGVGVWDIRDTMRFSHLTDLAWWRRKGFNAILKGNHQISKHMMQLLSNSEPESEDPLRDVVGKFEYVLSVFALKDHQWPVSQLKSALKLFCCPRILVEGEEESFDRSAAIEQERLLLDDFQHRDLREFGVFGSQFGYAGWAGVSYFGFNKQSSIVAARIVQFEVALQALWFFCHAINQRCRRKAGPRDQARLKGAAGIIHRELNRLKTIGPKDPTDERMMCEALFTTSRIESHAKAALESIERNIKKSKQ